MRRETGLPSGTLAGDLDPISLRFFRLSSDSPASSARVRLFRIEIGSEPRFRSAADLKKDVAASLVSKLSTWNSTWLPSGSL